jgi:hypothetical protein
MTQCKNHPGAAAVDRCAGCAESFCGACVVTVKGQKYCASCKTMAMEGVTLGEAGTIPCALAGEALKYAIFGLFCFGIILGPIAISKAAKAKREIAANPRLTGSGKATAAQVVGVLVIVLWVIGIMVRLSN